MSTEYTKTTWQTGDIITADKMNNIENGIKGIEGDITTLSGMGSEIDELGEELTDIKDGLEDLEETVSQLGGLSDDVKQALLQIASKVAYIDEDGQDYYDALEAALYPSADLVSISCVYTQSGTVYDTDSLDSLKSDLVVTAHYSDQTTETVTTYTLSGTLTAGTSTVTVSYGGKTTTFAVTVTHKEQKSDMNGWTDGIAYTDLTIINDEYVDKTDGSFDTYTGWNRTGYVPIDGASTLVISQMSGSGGGSGYNAFYTQNHVFISAFEMVHTGTSTVNVPSNAYYFVLSEKASQLAQVISDGVVPNA